MPMKITAPLEEFNEALGINVYTVRLEDEPALWFQRTNISGRSMAYVIPLSLAYLVSDERTLMERGFIMARELGLDMQKSTIFKLMDLLQKHIDVLVKKIPPAPVLRADELANKIDRSGIKSVKIDGQEMLH